MGVDYREQYEPDQLEKFWPNEIIKMTIAVLCTLSVIMILAVLPVILEAVGLGGVLHQEQPADPHGGTPVGIKPEWYFLSAYQYLKLMPTELLGLSGKTLGVLSQGLVMLLIALLPFWYRRRAGERASAAYRLAVTGVIAVLIVLTLWGGWPEHDVGGHEKLVPLGEYFHHKPMLFIVIGLAAAIFFALIAHERAQIRRILHRGKAQS